MEKCKLDTYEYYISLLDLIVSDISNANISDVCDVLDELHVEIKKIEGEN